MRLRRLSQVVSQGFLQWHTNERKNLCKGVEKHKHRCFHTGDKGSLLDVCYFCILSSRLWSPRRTSIAAIAPTCSYVFDEVRVGCCVVPQRTTVRALDSTLHNCHQNIKWENIFWRSGVHLSSRVQRLQYAKEHWSWSCRHLLRHLMFVFPLFFHPSVHYFMSTKL